MESDYEKARRLAAGSTGYELPGIDWAKYRDTRYDTLPKNLRSEAFEAEKDKGRIEQHLRTVPGAHNPWGFIERPDEYQQEEVSDARQKVGKVVTKHPFPEGMHMEHTVTRGKWGGAIHDIVLHDPKVSAPFESNGKR
jgi:hypothetical protein